MAERQGRRAADSTSTILLRPAGFEGQENFFSHAAYRLPAMLAEISDKMLTVPQLWLWACLLSIPVFVGLVRKWLAILTFAAASALSIYLFHGAYDGVFMEGDFSRAVQAEMGPSWIAHSLASTLLPALLALMVLAWRMKRQGKVREREIRR